MKKKILGGIILGTAIFSFAGCDAGIDTKSEKSIEYQCTSIENEIGLESMSNNNFKKIIESASYMDPEYKTYRASKIKSELLTEDKINEVVNRAKLVANRDYQAPNNYVLMNFFSDVDSLGFHISKDLALNLLKKTIEFRTVEEISNKINTNDESLYWYVYVGNLLKDYYRTTTDFSNEEKACISEYLATMRTYPKLASDPKKKMSYYNQLSTTKKLS
ncbi:hypothetical protein [uncultured Clostridium sp.]|uniref:hypothetical protein n=1 Tax=uncultured Clostridium sp. TaxID=59620 RepID=UPI00260AD5FC|nr:hypothetical protein [uncultured Clostridium sp.]